MHFQKVIPELYCSDFQRSLEFYQLLGFSVRYARTDERFAYLDREGAELMIEQTVDPTRIFVAGELSYPFGNGMNLQITVSDAEQLYEIAKLNNCRVFLPLEEKWYRVNEEEKGNRQFVVMDPDGYMLRFAQDLGIRSL